MERGIKRSRFVILFVMKNGDFMAISWEYPLVMTNVANWKITMLLMGKSTISMAIFNSYVKLPEGNGND